MNNCKIKINGETVCFPKSVTISEMLSEKKVTGKMFVVEKNGKIIPKENYSSSYIEDNDIIEIVGFFGGG